MASKYGSSPLFLGDLGQDPSAAEFGFDNDLVFERDHGQKLLQALHGPFPVVLFPPFEDEHDLNLVAIGDEFVDLFDLDLEIVLCGACPESDLFQVARFLQSALFLRFLLFLIPELVVVDDLGDGRLGVRGDLDEIKSLFVSDPQRLRERINTEEFSLLVDDAQFRRFDLMVESKWLFQISYWLV